ncbi:hypothetical protein AVEN_66110-1 [Araneus ventricosus]|uniref:Uncharacterized protein n=1 Tax=Araneus ventricosus TaxID=182803 RepID=A0A4Y2G162_ARAVE|nr:hypothetical protein AVEN_66110-1 [Araneus ventricosus]
METKYCVSLPSNKLKSPTDQNVYRKRGKQYLKLEFTRKRCIQILLYRITCLQDGAISNNPFLQVFQHQLPKNALSGLGISLATLYVLLGLDKKSMFQGGKFNRYAILDKPCFLGQESGHFSAF